MKTRLTTALAAAAFAVAAFAMTPASAAPASQMAPALKTAAGTSAAVEVQFRRYDRRGQAHRWNRDKDRGWNRPRRHGPRYGHHPRWQRNCIQTVRVSTPWGYQWRRVNVCR